MKATKANFYSCLLIHMDEYVKLKSFWHRVSLSLVSVHQDCVPLFHVIWMSYFQLYTLPLNMDQFHLFEPTTNAFVWGDDLTIVFVNWMNLTVFGVCVVDNLPSSEYFLLPMFVLCGKQGDNFFVVVMLLWLVLGNSKHFCKVFIIFTFI